MTTTKGKAMTTKEIPWTRRTVATRRSEVHDFHNGLAAALEAVHDDEAAEAIHDYLVSRYGSIAEALITLEADVSDVLEAEDYAAYEGCYVAFTDPRVTARQSAGWPTGYGSGVAPDGYVPDGIPTVRQRDEMPSASSVLAFATATALASDIASRRLVAGDTVRVPMAVYRTRKDGSRVAEAVQAARSKRPSRTDANVAPMTAAERKRAQRLRDKERKNAEALLALNVTPAAGSDT